MCQALCLGDGETRTERPVHAGKEPQPLFRQSQADTEHYSADGAHKRTLYTHGSEDLVSRLIKGGKHDRRHFSLAL